MFILLFCLLFTTLGNFLGSKAEGAEESGEQYLVSLKSEVDSNKWANKKELKNKMPKKLKSANTLVVRMNSSEYKKMKADPDIILIEPDSTVTLSTDQAGTTDYNNIETVPWGIAVSGAVYAHNDHITGQGVKIAVLDTGISTTHPDLHVAGGASFIDGVTSYNDDNGHGTHIAGTISAMDNDYGVLGMAPEAEIYALKVLDASGSGYYSSVIQAIEWCIENDIDILSMSFGGMENSEILHQAIQEANHNGILIIAAAGNGGNGNTILQYPAQFPEVVAVGSVGSSNQRSSFSNTGIELDLMAPGETILSTSSNGGYEIKSGTSVAVPHITGAAALLWAEEAALTSDQVKRKLFETATPLGDNQEYGHGLVNVAHALGLNETPINPQNPPPTEPETLDMAKLDLEIKNLLRMLGIMQAKAFAQNSIILAKEISGKYNNLLITYNGLRQVPNKVTDSVYGVNQANMENDYLESNKEGFIRLKKMYQQEVGYYWGLLRAENPAADDIGLSDTNICCGQIVDPFIEVGETANVSLYQVTPGPVEVIVTDQEGNYVFYNVIEYGNNIFFSWQTTAQTLPGVYTIGMSHPVYPFWQTSFGVTVQSSTQSSTPVYLNTPIDIGVYEGEYRIFQFTPSETRDYRLFTHPPSGAISFTRIELYSDEQLSNLVASSLYNSTLTSEIVRFLTSNHTYYLKIYADYGNTSESTFTISHMIDPLPISVNQLKNIDEPEFGSKLFYFIAEKTGTYLMKTDSIDYVYDTAIFVYSDINQTQEIAYADDAYQTVLTELRINLVAGELYFIKVAANYFDPLHATFEITEEPNTFISLSSGSHIDASFPAYTVGLYSFTPAVSGEHKIFTGPYGGYGGSNDTYLSIYSDPGLAHMLSYNDDANGTSFSELKHNLIAGTTYYIALQGYYDSGVYTRLKITPPSSDSIPPTAPTNLMVTNRTASSVSLKWTASTDNVAVTGYNIFKDGVLIGSTVDETIFKISGLTPSTPYTFTVVAKDFRGNTSEGSSINVTTASYIPKTLILALNNFQSIEGSGSVRELDNGSNFVDVSMNSSSISSDLIEGVDYFIDDGRYWVSTNSLPERISVSYDHSTLTLSQDAIMPNFDDQMGVQSTATINTQAANYTSMTDEQIMLLANKIYKYYMNKPNATYREIYEYIQQTSVAESMSSLDISVQEASGNVIYDTDAEGNIILNTEETTALTELYLSPTIRSPLLYLARTMWTVGAPEEKGSQLFFNDSPARGNKEAFVYAYWGALLVLAADIEWARIYTDAHVNGSNDSASQKQVQLHNTRVGRQIAYNYISRPNYNPDDQNQIYNDLTQEIMESIDSGNLKRLDLSENIVETDSTGQIPDSYIDIQAPTAPTALMVKSRTASSISFNWTASTDNIAVTGYDIYLGSNKIGTVAGNVTTFTATGLSSNTMFTLTVKAKDAAENTSIASNAVSASTDVVPPSAPTNLRISSTPTEFNFVLTWIAASDNVGVTRYEIYNGSTLVGSTNGEATFTVTGLQSGMSYTFTVKAKDIAGNVSQASNDVLRYIYVYDSSGRLDYVQLAPDIKVDYMYDMNGNLLGKELVD